MHAFTPQNILRISFLIAVSAAGLSAQGRITCSSDNGQRVYCSADTRRGVQLVNQRSGSPCVQGRTWGYDNRGIWVDRGCRAEFVVGRVAGGGYPGNRPGNGNNRPGNSYSQPVTCSSENGKRNYCRNDTNGSVRLVRQRSGSRCTQGYSWGTQPGSIWVDHGCRADFEILTRR